MTNQSQSGQQQTRAGQGGSQQEIAQLKSQGLKDATIQKAQLLGLPSGTIISLITKYGPQALQIIEEILAGIQAGSSTPTPAA